MLQFHFGIVMTEEVGKLLRRLKDRHNINTLIEIMLTVTVKIAVAVFLYAVSKYYCQAADVLINYCE